MKGQFGVFEEATLCRDVAQVTTPTPRAKPDPTQDTTVRTRTVQNYPHSRSKPNPV